MVAKKQMELKSYQAKLKLEYKSIKESNLMDNNLKTIVIDAMGGDHGPKVTVQAAINATKNKDVILY